MLHDIKKITFYKKLAEEGKLYGQIEIVKKCIYQRLRIIHFFRVQNKVSSNVIAK